ncbi:hypothetical protein MJ1_0595 [Nanobdella aerobiophila]|uniref:Uncharacterized protein n=1 Tax=Nanobdella aerobiophila TaxID=2586965 RepID=A0A915WSX0_9ARCH|nr:hypothetical protein MJ1_0595 [Nanobdella aerobiophila]
MTYLSIYWYELLIFLIIISLSFYALYYALYNICKILINRKKNISKEEINKKFSYTNIVAKTIVYIPFFLLIFIFTFPLFLIFNTYVIEYLLSYISLFIVEKNVSSISIFSNFLSALAVFGLYLLFINFAKFLYKKFYLLNEYSQNKTNLIDMGDNLYKKFYLLNEYSQNKTNLIDMGDNVVYNIRFLFLIYLVLICLILVIYILYYWIHHTLPIKLKISWNFILVSVTIMLLYPSLLSILLSNAENLKDNGLSKSIRNYTIQMFLLYTTILAIFLYIYIFHTNSGFSHIFYLVIVTSTIFSIFIINFFILSWYLKNKSAK